LAGIQLELVSGHFAPEGNSMKKHPVKLKKKAAILLVLIAFLVAGMVSWRFRYPIAESFQMTVTQADEYENKPDERPKTLEDWQKINPDIRFLINFDSKGILYSFPVLVTDKADFYMNHNVWGNYDTMGAVFIDKTECPLAISNNWIIYGHSSKHRQWAFTFLKNYTEAAYFKANPTFILIDENGEHICSVISFASYNVSKDDTYMGWYNNRFSNTQAVENMLKGSKPYVLQQKSDFKYDGRQLLTLVTCDMEQLETRYVTFAEK
jgi:SrtB family sortase